ncbi:MAG TPA: glycosyltransferase family 2 protein [Bacteroidales bacterium]|nr:glycosyltransferase family 2 protein [Bacteroidales bacterium]
MVVFIINYNRLTLPRNIADWCHAHGLEPVIVDNNSNYPLLLEYYEECPYQVIMLERNYGHKCIWDLGLIDELEIKDRYIITDPDLDLSGVPDDFLDVMSKGLDKYPSYDKCGLSLEINDLPDSDEGRFIRSNCEAGYWTKPLDPLYFHADTDTTFALYRENSREYNYNAIRTNRPYTARHIPWYYTDFNLLPEDEQYYFNSASRSSSGKKRLFK